MFHCILWAEIIAVSREVFTMTARFLPHFISSLVLLVCVGGIPSLATTASAKENDKSTPEPIVVVPLDHFFGKKMNKNETFFFCMQNYPM